MSERRPMRAKAELDFRVLWTHIVALIMILVLWGGLYAIEQVSGTFRNAGEAERILREYPRR